MTAIGTSQPNPCQQGRSAVEREADLSQTYLREQDHRSIDVQGWVLISNSVNTRRVFTRVSQCLAHGPQSQASETGEHPNAAMKYQSGVESSSPQKIQSAQSDDRQGMREFN